MKKVFLTYKDFINEGGNAFKKIVRFEFDDKNKIFERVIEIMEKDLDFKLSEYSIVGSFNSKEDEIGDIDLVIHPKEKIFNFSSLDKTYDNLDKLSKRIGNHKDLKINDQRISKTLGVFSLSSKIGNKNVQIDLIPVPNKEWGTWSYHSPNTEVSTYKGLYRNALLEAIAKSIHFDIEYYSKDEETKYIKEGDVKSYTRYRYLRNAGLWTVREVNKGTRVLRYEKERETYSPESDNPDKVISLLLGNKNSADKYLTFESVLNEISKKNWKNTELLPTILENFRIIIEDRQKNEVPSIIQQMIKEYK